MCAPPDFRRNPASNHSSPPVSATNNKPVHTRTHHRRLRDEIYTHIDIGNHGIGCVQEAATAHKHGVVWTSYVLFAFYLGVALT